MTKSNNNVIYLCDYIKSKDFMESYGQKKIQSTFIKDELDAQMLVDWLMPYEEDEKKFWEKY